MLHPKLLNPNWSEAGTAAGFTRVHIARVCRGQNHTTLDGAAKIAQVFGITLDELYAHIQASRAARASVERRLGKAAPSATSGRKRGQRPTTPATKKAPPPAKKKAPAPKPKSASSKRGRALSLTAT